MTSSQSQMTSSWLRLEPRCPDFRTCSHTAFCKWAALWISTFRYRGTWFCSHKGFPDSGNNARPGSEPKIPCPSVLWKFIKSIKELRIPETTLTGKSEVWGITAKMKTYYELSELLSTPCWPTLKENLSETGLVQGMSNNHEKSMKIFYRQR